MPLNKLITRDNCNLLQAKVGRLKESDSALQRLRGKNADVHQEAAEIRVCNMSLFIRMLLLLHKLTGRQQKGNISFCTLHSYL